MRSRRRRGKSGRCRFRIAARWLGICVMPLRRRMEFRRCSLSMRRWNWRRPREGGGCRWQSLSWGIGRRSGGRMRSWRRCWCRGDMENAASAFLKLGARRYLVISISMVAAVLQDDAAGRVSEARVAVGSCSAKAQRLVSLEQDLVGARMAAGIGGAVTGKHLSSLSPIDDARATAEYRRDASLTLVRRTLEACVRSL